MPKLSLKAGTTSKSVLIFVQDSSQTDGRGLAGLAFNTASLIAYSCQPGVTAATVITLATLASATAAWSSGGFKEIDATNMKGWYRLDLPNVTLTGATSVGISLSGAANMAPVNIEIELTANDNQTAAVTLPTIPANWITAAGINAAAFTDAKFDTGTILNAAPSDTAGLPVKVQWLFQMGMFQRVTTPTAETIGDNMGNAIASATVGVVGTTITRGKFV